LIFVWCNVNEIKPKLNLDRAPNSQEVSRTKGFENLKIHPQTRTKGSMKQNYKPKPKVPFKIKEPHNIPPNILGYYT